MGLGSAGVKEAPQQFRNITRLYNENCGNCHGENGQGGAAGTPSLLTREKFDMSYDKKFFDSIKNGVKDQGMEAFGQTMSDKEIWGLVVHIRELQGRALRAAESNKKELGTVYSTMHAKYKVEEVVGTDQGLKVPWSMAFLPSGEMLVTNRPGWMAVIRDGKVVSRVEGLPKSIELGQGGLMDVRLHPDYAKNGWIYLSIADPKKDGSRNAITKILRGKLSVTNGAYKWTDEQTLFESPQEFYTGAGQHFGGKFAFDGKGHVFFSHGERGQGDLAQDLSRPNGKIHRINDDGTIPTDNPFYNKAGALKTVWSYGHRNPQGITIDKNGQLWDTEHGPRGGDEVNMIQKGHNYGWPLVAFSIDYNDSAKWTPWPTPSQDITLPVSRWLPSTGASGFCTMSGKAFPEWDGDLIAGGLVGQNIDRFRMKDGKMVEHEELLWGMGRVRDLICGPEGDIYVALNDPDKIVRLVPAK